MIKNVVFDFGQVLVRFDPSYMVGQYVTEREDAELLVRVLFDRLYWDRLDAGTITDKEVVHESCKRLPARLWDVAERIYYSWIYNLPEIDGMRNVVKSLRERGVRLLLLSNISTYFSTHAGEIPILSYFDRCVFSAVCGYVKPSREIFAYLCTECALDPRETVFVDDNAANIAGAEAYGITGYLFDGDSKKLASYFDKMLSEENG
ncbi:MAG: HAD family phosphatase [Ruminococcaceae bacterium]|nr:HAD family phosphatase [Oscillospiraceae bacterium]